RRGLTATPTPPKTDPHISRTTTMTIKATFTAALAAASLLGASAAFAGGDYYQGVSPDSAQNQRIDRTTTQSIHNVTFDGAKAARSRADVNTATGDYNQCVYKHQ